MGQSLRLSVTISWLFCIHTHPELKDATVKRGDLGRFQLFFVSTLEAFSNMTVKMFLVENL